MFFSLGRGRRGVVSNGKQSNVGIIITPLSWLTRLNLIRKPSPSVQATRAGCFFSPHHISGLEKSIQLSMVDPSLCENSYIGG
jgi:hypothetical protein